MTTTGRITGEALKAYRLVESFQDDGESFQALRRASLEFSCAVDAARELRAYAPGKLRQIVRSNTETSP